MKNTLSENIVLLNKDAGKIQQLRFSMLFSINRNQYFSFIKNYILFYNEYRRMVLAAHATIPAEALPELEYKNYSLSVRYQVLLIIFFPVSFFLFIIHWNYILDLKRKLHAGLGKINEAVKKPVSRNSNYTAPKVKRK
jgi:hypothetical protein